MKNNGLKNRFPQEVRLVWLYWVSCLLCHFNQQDVLHHIVSPSSRLYVDGDHNESVFNSCPIHNQTHPSASNLKRQGYKGFGVDRSCHIGNEAHLYAEETIRHLLQKVRDILLNELDYEPNEKDKRFLKIYAHLYVEKG